MVAGLYIKSERMTGPARGDTAHARSAHVAPRDQNEYPARPELAINPSTPMIQSTAEHVACFFKVASNASVERTKTSNTARFVRFASATTLVTKVPSA